MNTSVNSINPTFDELLKEYKNEKRKYKLYYLIIFKKVLIKKVVPLFIVNLKKML